MTTRLRITVGILFHAEPKKVDGHWMLTTKEFGWTLFADTHDGLVKRLGDAATLFVDGFPATPDGMKALDAYLNKRGIKHDINVETVASEWSHGLQPLGVLFSESNRAMFDPQGTAEVSHTRELAYAK